MLSAKAVEYVRKLPKLPAEGAERLEAFQPYLEDADAILSRDAFDEFGNFAHISSHLSGSRTQK